MRLLLPYVEDTRRPETMPSGISHSFELREAQRRGWFITVAEFDDLSIRDGRAWGRLTEVRIRMTSISSRGRSTAIFLAAQSASSRVS